MFKNLSFELKKGKVYGLLGKNGAGKTTIINLKCIDLNPQKTDHLHSVLK